MATQQKQENRHAYQRGEHPHRQLDGRHHGAGRRIRPAQQHGTCQAGCGQQQALVIADRKPQRVRHDEPDEADELPDDEGGGDADELLASGLVSGSEPQPANASISALII